MKLFFSLFVILVSFDVMAYENPKYTVITQDGDFEIREYEAMLTAEVTTMGDREEAANEAFRILAGYIFGKNIANDKIAMTAPVTTQNTKSEKIAMTAPVTYNEKKNGDWQMRFMMPSKYTLETLPKPQDERIKFVKVPSKKFVVLRFSWWWSDSNINKHKELLEKYIAEKNIKTEGSYIFAGYNSPFTLPFLRRNEVMFKLKD
jgi:SOUL heme-binding protein